MSQKKNRNVGITGIGMTEISSHKENQNQPEMINEAASKKPLASGSNPVMRLSPPSSRRIRASMGYL